MLDRFWPAVAELVSLGIVGRIEIWSDPKWFRFLYRCGTREIDRCLASPVRLLWTIGTLDRLGAEPILYESFDFMGTTMPNSPLINCLF